MKIIKSEKQQDNLVKLIYDIGKIILAIIVISPVAKPGSFNTSFFVTGLICSILFFLFAYSLDGKEVRL